MKLLEVQSSVRLEKSISRTLSHEFIQTWQKSNPDGRYQQRDVGMNPPAHPTELWTTANYVPSDSRTSEMETALTESEQLIGELLWADRVLLGVPMYNFSVPSTFKAYVDNIVRVNRTFAFDPASFTFEGLATDKKALVITPSAGNFAPDTPMRSMNFCETYLRAILSFIGIEDMTIVAVPNQFMPDAIRQQSIEQARAKLMNLAATW
ncbi:MAG: NAD(P)H-dependent oxidoreductase [Microcoleus sp. PH2017_40_RAT_O_B]|uniref:FMN-dependent NADH-azoreductase n=1 Tax=unclassified Microcoleus TaxID=2642155 RepID=UPI001D1A9705|nr:MULTISPECIES: NAD(P)H-dependent oxidoreductase [unclassified Microcoleus]TAG07761.1 MAG: NAD(P)H dehydrogenase [Oscillatoriales cyanobacterium]MCC3434178.1 NAD(P)H-dependent oxidoreductase [Microcoleus sp. PH2017_05_CCC_O_A]MCC3571468.1 NAD(P)H-dependent oxidoreductase [Microcoleus sp. PH2017_34_RAT_O_A]MCC3584807.1 NAD(P)H-dependent oxidoreductase [Microcoleus sp. PH2017_30_WIL_O_A]MCC3609065.1 NAD(P)H-dependent oxidoreductase [Microcoleus sp. PH2017_40_RAT_O_B]